MREIDRGNRFEKDYKHARKRGWKVERLWPIVDLLAKNESLPARCRPHKLTGNMEGYWECHIEPDFLLIYAYAPGKLKLMRLGTHSDLFK